MAIFKCKMCGGSLEINNESVATCEYCGTQQTLPKLDDDRRVNLYDRANHFRRNNEFDKAMGIYEQILNEDNTDAEAYWSIVLCRYGIEYVEDPATRKRIPTVNRAQFTAIFDDDNYKSALQYADNQQKAIYESEAKAINEIQKGILAISQAEEPFDVFICYKETDQNGRRTPDSVLATELYHELTKEGFKVFFSRITLEDKLGSAYEPYIFAALNSAKVMVVLGTKQEHFNAVWMKNEWSRYLSLIKQGQKKMLIPAYRDMDPYDLPEEFSHLQAQDMSKLGFMQDLVRGIQKLAVKGEPKATVVKETVITAANTNTAPLLKRAFMFLEDGDWNSANEYCEKVLDIDPECAEAYLGKLMAELKVKTQKSLKDCTEPFDSSNNYQKALRFADGTLKNTLTGYADFIITRTNYSKAQEARISAKTALDFYEAAELFVSCNGYKDSDALSKSCYKEACRIAFFISETRWWESEEKFEESKEKLRLLMEQERQKLAQAKAAKARRKKLVTISAAILSIASLLALLLIIFIPLGKYIKAANLEKNGDIKQAAILYGKLDDYKDAKAKSFALWEQIAVRNTVNASGYYILGLKTNGTVVKLGYNDNVRNIAGWADIVAISTSGSHTIGLKADGTVVAEGSNSNGQCNVNSWMNIVAISAGETDVTASSHTVGLKADGTVVAVGSNFYGQCDVADWTDIVAISAGCSHTVGLKADGTVVAVGSNNNGQCKVSSWTDIVAISASGSHTVGLKADGTVVAIGNNKDGQCDVAGWEDITAISTSERNTVGLKADGTVVAVGIDESSQGGVTGWTDIVAINTGCYFVGHRIVGLKADGTLVAVGGSDADSLYGPLDITKLTNIKVPNK